MDPRTECVAPKRLITSPDFAKDDVSLGLTRCLMWPPYPDQALVCHFGDTTDPARRVALFGNSHAGHWTEAIGAIARKHHWQLDTYILGACDPTLIPLFNHCADIGAKTAAALLAGQYDLVVLSTQDRDPQSSAATYVPTLQGLTATDNNVLVIRDTPAPGDQTQLVADCLAVHPKDWSACDGRTRDWIGADPVTRAAKELGGPHVFRVNVNKYFCKKARCPAVIGGVIPYRDASHLTVTFAKSLIPYLEPAFERAMP